MTRTYSGWMAVGLSCSVLFVLGEPTSGPRSASAQESDLDGLMERVVSTRDDNWARMRQYVLEERETLRVLGPDGSPIYGFERDYAWFIRQGLFVRSPLRANGITIGESERLAFEEDWMRRERQRLADEKAADTPEQAADAGFDPTVAEPEPTPTPRDAVDRDQANTLDAVLDQAMQPRFVTAAYFLEFEFDPGQYALVGRETLDGHEVLRVEYYPTKLFDEGRTKPNRRVREHEIEVQRQLNKTTVVTLWVDPKAEQIRRYRADGFDWSFLPGSSIVQFEEIHGSMDMSEAFPGVWLPDAIEMRFGLVTALGRFGGRYEVRYHDYRLAEVTSTIRPAGPEPR